MDRAVAELATRADVVATIERLKAAFARRRNDR
jgi:hypothetical protein